MLGEKDSSRAYSIPRTSSQTVRVSERGITVSCSFVPLLFPVSLDEQ
jgi:hypothetical protein